MVRFQNKNKRPRCGESEEGFFWVNLRLRTYVKKAYVRIVKMHPKIDRPHPMHVIIDSGSLCSSLGWRKSKHSIVKLSVDVTTNLTDLSILSNCHQASVRRRRNLTSVIPRSSAEILALDCLQGQRITGNVFRIFSQLHSKSKKTFLTRRVLKPRYVHSGGPRAWGFRRWFANGLNQSLVSSEAKATSGRSC